MILDLLRSLPQGQLDSWLTLSALKKAKALYKANPHATVIFGGKQHFKLRAAGKITTAQRHAQRLSPLYFEGHAISYDEQGGKHRFVLDIEHNTVWFYPKAKQAFPLQLKLGKKSNYRELLEGLQHRCMVDRDTPFTIPLTEDHIAISWEEQIQPPKRESKPNRVLALDVNPHRIGAAVLDKRTAGNPILQWTIYEYPQLNQKLGLDFFSET